MYDARTRSPELNAVFVRRTLEEVKDFLVRDD